MTFSDYSVNSRKKINDFLASYCDVKKNEDLPKIFKEQRFIDSLSDFVKRGKLIRGTLFLLIVESFGVEIDEDILGVAVGIEFMHSALLIQDDIIDNDYTRRGAKTVFASFEDDGKDLKISDPYHYGISNAIVVADIAFFFAIDLLAKSKSETLGKLMQYYAHEVYLVSVAEGVDSVFGQTTKDPSENDIYSVYKYKTARYTFSLPFEMAAIVGKSPDNTRQSLSQIGELAGIIFQLKDDEIGLFGEEEVIGKPVGSDIRENKKTIIRHLLFERADEKEKKILSQIFGRADLERDDIEKVRTFYEKFNIRDFINNEIDRRMEKIWELFENLKIGKVQKEILKGLLEYNLKRSY